MQGTNFRGRVNLLLAKTPLTASVAEVKIKARTLGLEINVVLCI